MAANGYGTKVMVVAKDARRMAVLPAPDGTPPDMESPADILVFEVPAAERTLPPFRPAACALENGGRGRRGGQRDRKQRGMLPH